MARGRRNLKRKRKSQEASAQASSVGVDHADDLMKRNSKHQSPATKSAAASEAQPASAGIKTKEKRKRVVRERLPEELIQIMIVNPMYVYEIPNEDLARYSEEARASYAERKERSEKSIAEHQALIDQCLINGYAEYVGEVTDDDTEEMVDIVN